MDLAYRAGLPLLFFFVFMGCFKAWGQGGNEELMGGLED